MPLINRAAQQDSADKKPDDKVLFYIQLFGFSPFLQEKGKNMKVLKGK